MRINELLSASRQEFLYLKQEFLDKFPYVLFSSLIIGIAVEIVDPSLPFLPVFVGLFFWFMALYLVIVEISRLWEKGKVITAMTGKGKKIDTVGQAEEAQKKLAFLKEEKAALVKDKEFSQDMIDKSAKKVRELQQKKREIGDLALNAAGVEKEIRSEDWALGFYPKQIKSLDARIKEIDDEMAKINDNLEKSIRAGKRK